MLALTRRTGETIVLGEDVALTIIGVNGNQVRFGIIAPKETSVYREEIYLKIQAAKAADSPT